MKFTLKNRPKFLSEYDRDCSSEALLRLLKAFEDYFVGFEKELRENKHRMEEVARDKTAPNLVQGIAREKILDLKEMLGEE